MSTVTDVTIYFADEPVVLNSAIFERVTVRKSVNHETDSFSATTPNVAGSRIDTFNIGQEVKIYHDVGSPANNQIFLGRIEYINPDADVSSGRITVGGRDYSSRLMDTKVQALYTSGTSNVCEVGSIVRDLIWTSPFSGLIGVASVSGTTKIVDNFRLKNKSVYEAVNQLADFVQYNFWVDYNKVLHFEPENTTNSNIIVGGGVNVKYARVREDALQMFNRVVVCGDKTFVRTQQSFTADGGSVFTLTYNPHDTYVTDAGTKKEGGVYELTAFLPTGVQYLVDYDEKRVIFISGTNSGDNIPASGNTVVVQYSRGVAIVKEAQDDASIETHGDGVARETVIVNKEIKDPKQAKDIVQAELARLKDPFREAQVQFIDANISGIQPGQLVTVNLPLEGISGASFKVLETIYTITKENMLENSVVGIKAGNRINDTSDILRDIIIKQRQLQSSDTDSGDTITRLRTAGGSFGIKAHWYIRQRTDLGSSFVLGHLTMGDLGSGANQANPQTYLGDSRSALTITESGGDWSF